MDIVEIILSQHHEQRSAFAQLDDVARDDAEHLTPLWTRLAVLLEVHAEAEERFFYPRLLELGKGADSVEEEVKDAVKDHNEIRDGLRKAREEQPGTAAWWKAVEATRKANGDHMAEEERDDLPDFCRKADLQARHEVAVEFIAYEHQHFAGIPLHDRDPDEYVKQKG